MRQRHGGILLLMCCLPAGCNALPSGPLAASFQRTSTTFEVDPSFRAGLGVLAEGEQAAESPSFQPADCLLMGVKVAHGAEQDVWFVRLSLFDLEPQRDEPAIPLTKEFAVPFGMGGVKTGAKFTAPIGKLLVEMFDEHGTLQRSSLRTVPRVFGSWNLLDVLSGRGCAVPAAVAAGTANGATAVGDVNMQDLSSVLTVLQMIGGAKSLGPIRDAIRDHIISRPSLLAILLNGLRLKVEAPMELRELVQSPWLTHLALTPREEAKFPVLLSGERLFDCRVVVAPTNPPFNLTAGAVLIEAVHPEKPENRLTLCVLAGKHCGSSAMTVAARQ